MIGAMSGATVERVFVEDERRDGKFLRLTWHGDRRTFVVSTWDGSVCVGATRVPVSEAPALIHVLARGLADATTTVPGPTPPRSLVDHLRTWWRDRLRSSELNSRRAPIRPVPRRCA
jgi:hypothetical protein